jgi:gluconate 2-dehydrogenase subunit 3-like protein
MKPITRRTALKAFASAPVAAAMVWTPAEANQAQRRAQQAKTEAEKQGAPYQPKFFTPHEYATVGVLVDLIIPKDERSGSATDAGVPEFMDFMMIDEPRRRTAMRGGLAMIDRLCEQRFDKRFVDCSDQQRRALLDDIAFPGRATPAQGTMSQAIAFFSSFRDLTASGFWSSKMGVDDLKYMGNTYVREWKGCPDEALKKLGVSYEGD